jgi:hypothetical protein
MDILISYYGNDQQVIDGYPETEDSYTIDDELSEMIESTRQWVSRYGSAATIYDKTNKKMVWKHPNFDKIIDNYFG